VRERGWAPTPIDWRRRVEQQNEKEGSGAGESRPRGAAGQRGDEELKKARVSFRWKKVEASTSKTSRRKLLGSGLNSQVLNRLSPKHWGFFFYLNRYRVPVPVPGPHFLDPAPEPVATGSGILEPV